jgi:hypothetical protein
MMEMFDELDEEYSYVAFELKIKFRNEKKKRKIVNYLS